MMKTISDSLLLPQLQNINNGDHAAYLYRDPFEQIKVLQSFIGSGIQQGYEVVCFIHPQTKQQLLNITINGKHTIDELCSSGQLVIEDLSSLTRHNTDAVGVIQSVIEGENQKAKRNSKGEFRIALELSDVTPPGVVNSNIPQLVENIITLLNKYHCASIFLYPQKFDGTNASLELLSLHPCIFIHDKIYRHQAQKQIKNRQQLENTIAQRTQELAQTILHLEREISKRQQIAAFLTESEQRYRALVDGSPAPIFVIQDEKFIFCNQAVIKMLGLSRNDDLIGKPIDSVIDSTFISHILKESPRPKTSYQKSPYIIQLHGLDDAIIHFEAVTVPITFSGKSAHLMIGYDVTERVHTENALKQSEETSRTLINAVHEAFYLLNPDSTIISSNDEGIKRLDMKAEMIIGVPFLSCLKSRAAKEHQKYMDMVISSGEPATFNTSYKQRFLKNTIYPIFNENKQTVRLALYSRDVSDRVRTEKALQRHAQEMDALYSTFIEITTRMDLSTLLPLIVMRAVTLMDETSGGLYLVCPDKESIELVVSYKQNRDYTGTCLKFGEGLSGKIAQNGQPMFIMNYSNWEGKPEAYNDSTIHRVLGVPLKVGGQVIGVLNISNYKKKSSYTQEEIRLASLFADQAAIAIENTRLLETAQHEIEERIQATEALKASLAEKEVMLREIHHRVKNNLNVIIALLDLQEDSSNIPQASPLFNDLKSRVRTMALVHESLYQSADLRRVDFASYIKTLVEFLFATYALQLNIDLELDVPPIPLTIDTAIPCGLIVNELVTNAIKYAFP
ncbi:MAG: GAF domain-containing protein, partial [Anaerolineales bacterium]|nr:GAF domain-containing protein [Anaerolineales bacterium]